LEQNWRCPKIKKSAFLFKIQKATENIEFSKNSDCILEYGIRQKPRREKFNINQVFALVIFQLLEISLLELRKTYVAP